MEIFDNSLTSAGGHSTSGDASSDGGLVIDMRKMHAVSVNSDDKTVTCQGGCLWEDVDKAAAEHGLATVGGTVNQTGVGGLTLGGGYGFLSGQLGLAIDRLVSAEIVLASGQIVTCSATSEPDLFWAIRGAGHTFGVATQFTFQAVEKTNLVYGGRIVWPALPALVTPIIEFANALAASSDGRAGCLVGFVTPPPMKGKRAIFVVCFYDGPKEEGEKIYAPLLNLSVPPVLNTLAEIPYPAMNEVLSVAALRGGRRVSKGATFQPPLPPSAFQKILDLYNEFVVKVPEAASQPGVALFEFYATGKICEVGDQDTAFSNRGTHQNAMILPRWLNKEFDDVARQFAHEAMDVLKETIKEGGRGVGEYLNYDGMLHVLPTAC